MLELTNVALRHGDTLVARGLSMELAPGDIGCLLGPSGCGKTTVLRAVAGFQPVAGGSIRIAGQTVSDTRVHVPPQQRQVGIVFQEHVLFPHLDVQSNVAFGLGGLTAAQRQARVRQMLALVGLQDFERRWPYQLSGGQQQRVALARALAPRPRLLLLDEPFSNLDAALRVSLAREVRDILRREQITALLVTHDQQEAFAVAHRIGVMADGRLLQWAGADTLYQRPATAQVGLFVGDGVLLRAWRAAGRWHTALGAMDVHTCIFDADSEPRALIRPESLRMDPGASVRARVLDRTYCGHGHLYTLVLPGGEQVRLLDHGQAFQVPGAEVGLRHEACCAGGP